MNIGLSFEDYISKIFEKENLSFYHEKDLISKFGCEFVGVDFLVMKGEKLLFIQCKYQEKSSPQKDVSHFKDCVRRILKLKEFSPENKSSTSSSDSTNEKHYFLWLSRKYPTKGGMKSLHEIGGEVICHDSNFSMIGCQLLEWLRSKNFIGEKIGEKTIRNSPLDFSDHCGNVYFKPKLISLDTRKYTLEQIRDSLGGKDINHHRR